MLTGKRPLLLGQECADANAVLLFVIHDGRLAVTFNREIDLTSIDRTLLKNPHETANVISHQKCLVPMLYAELQKV